MRIKYETVVIDIGDLAYQFKELGMLVLFKNGVSKDLSEFSFIQDIKHPMEEDIKVNDNILIGEKEYKVTSIGDHANATLKELGHATLKFDSAPVPELPGCIHLSPSKFPYIKNGTILKYFHK